MYTPKIIHIKISIGSSMPCRPVPSINTTTTKLEEQDNRFHKISIIGQINPPSSLYGACTANK